jgi:hypothetical protein
MMAFSRQHLDLLLKFDDDTDEAPIQESSCESRQCPIVVITSPSSCVSCSQMRFWILDTFL